MEFLAPGFLFALLALVIPVIIHLFNFRRFKKIPFTNVRFLKEIKFKTQSKNRLKHLLVLLMRLLALAFLVFAFAQPIIPDQKRAVTEAGNLISVFLDNSFSMEGESESGIMLDVAKNKAIEIAKAYPNTARFQLLTQDFEGKHQRFVGKTEFIDLVTDVGSSPLSRSLTDIALRQNDLLLSQGGEEAKNSFIISDFQKSRYDFTDFQPDSTVRISLISLERNATANVYIDSIWFSSPIRKVGESEQLMVRIANTGSEAVENVPLTLTVNGAQKAISSFGAKGGETADTSMFFIHDSPGIKNVKVAIDDFPITYDDAYYFSYQVYDQVNILSIEPSTMNAEPFISGVFGDDSTFVFERTSVTGINYDKLPNRDLVIIYELSEIPSGLSGSLIDFCENGGSVWLIPAADPNISSYNEFLGKLGVGNILDKKQGDFSIRELNLENPLYKGIFERLPKNPDLPKATTYFKFSNPLAAQTDYLMRFGNRDDFLASNTAGSGKFYFLAAPLRTETNNFSRHALFVASALRMAELSKATTVLSATIGESFLLPPTPLSGDQVFRLVSEKNQTDVIPLFRPRNGQLEISPGPGISSSGNYQVLLAADTIAGVGLNYPRLESNLESYTTDELVSLRKNFGDGALTVLDGALPNLTEKIEQISRGTELWKICLILALLFLLLETVLLRIWKN